MKPSKLGRGAILQFYLHHFFNSEGDVARQFWDGQTHAATIFCAPAPLVVVYLRIDGIESDLQRSPVNPVVMPRRTNRISSDTIHVMECSGSAKDDGSPITDVAPAHLSEEDPPQQFGMLRHRM